MHDILQQGPRDQRTRGPLDGRRIGVWCLIVFTVIANAIFHRFWIVHDPLRRNVTRLLLINGIAILGGLLLLLENVR